MNVNSLTPKECRLLVTLMQYAGQIPPRESLMQEVCKTEYNVGCSG